MILSHLVILIPIVLTVPNGWTPGVSVVCHGSAGQFEQDDALRKEYERRKEEASQDAGALWELYLWCNANAMEKEARACLRTIIKLEPNHGEARELLGHIQYDGRWFTSEKLLEKYKREEEDRVAKEKGLVQYEDRWVAPEDVPFLKQGLIRDDDGRWVNAEEQEKLKAGWRRQDLEWVSPEEAANLEKGLWKCGERWLELAEANQFHSQLDHWWIIPKEHFLLYTTCDREVAMKALEVMERAHREVVRTFGLTPEIPLPVVLLRDSVQYNLFAGGSEGARQPTELRALSSIHHAYFADAWFDEATGRFRAAGVGCWDASTESGNSFGPHAVRHAAAQSFVEAIDPSPKTVAKGEKSRGFEETDAAEFWGEKKLPEWLRYGAASYAERYFVDQFVKTGGDPLWARAWSIQNIASRGGLRPLDQVFQTKLTVNDREGSEKLLNERGLIMAFMLDGNCAPVTAAHADLKEALRTGKDLPKAVEKLEKAIEKHETELRQFAGL